MLEEMLMSDDIIEQGRIQRSISSNNVDYRKKAKFDTIYYHACCLKGPIAALYKSALWWMNKNRYISCSQRNSNECLSYSKVPCAH